MNKIYNSLRAVSTPYESILESVKKVTESLGISERGGAVGFYDANFRNSDNRYDICLRLFPLRPEIISRYELQTGERLDRVLCEHFCVRRPYDYLFHIKNLKSESQEDTSEGIYRADTSEHFFIDKKEERIERSWRSRVECDIESGVTFLEHLSKCRVCSERAKSALSQTGTEYYNILNNFDLACMRPGSENLDRWLAVPLPFLSSPASLVVAPLLEREGRESGVRYAMQLINRSKTLIQTYVFNRIIREMSLQEKSLRDVSSRHELVYIFVRILIRILLPQEVVWDKDSGSERFKINKEHEWPRCSEQRLHVKLAGGGSCEVTLPTFYYPSGYSVSSDGITGGYICEKVPYQRELKSTQQLLESTFEMLLTRWRNARVEQTQMLALRYQHIKGDLDALMDQIATMRNTALRIEEQVSPANVGFLRLYDEMKLLFKSEATIYYARVAKSKDGTDNRTGGAGGRIVGPYLRKEQVRSRLQNSEPIREIRTAHGAKNLGEKATNVWNSYVGFLKEKYKDTSIEFLNLFGTVGDSSVKYAENQFTLLKMLLQRPHIAGEPLYAMQILVACVVESNITGRDQLAAKITAYVKDDSASPIDFEEASDLIPTVCFDKAVDFEAWLQIEKTDSTNYVDLPSEMSAGKVLEALMRLIGTELQGVEEGVTVESVTVRSPEGGCKIETFIECRGTFPDLSILTSLGPNAEDRGLRSCLKTLCESVNRRNLTAVDNIKPENALDQFREQDDHYGHRFMIGQYKQDEPKQDHTWFYLAFVGKRPESQQFDGSAAL